MWKSHHYWSYKDIYKGQPNCDGPREYTTLWSDIQLAITHTVINRAVSRALRSSQIKLPGAIFSFLPGTLGFSTHKDVVGGGTEAIDTGKLFLVEFKISIVQQLKWLPAAFSAQLKMPPKIFVLWHMLLLTLCCVITFEILHLSIYNPSYLFSYITTEH